MYLLFLVAVSFFKRGGMWYIGLFIVCMSFPVIPLLISARINSLSSCCTELLKSIYELFRSRASCATNKIPHIGYEILKYRGKKRV